MYTLYISISQEMSAGEDAGKLKPVCTADKDVMVQLWKEYGPSSSIERRIIT
jgi:hypothetical protein